MQNIKDYLARIYGMDALSCGLILLSVLINLATTLLFKQGVQAARLWNLVNFIPLLICLLRFFSTNHERRARANQWFVGLLDTIFGRKDGEVLSDQEILKEEYHENVPDTDRYITAESRKTMADLTGQNRMQRGAEAQSLHADYEDEPTRYMRRDAERVSSIDNRNSGRFNESSPDQSRRGTSAERIEKDASVNRFRQEESSTGQQRPGRRYRASADRIQEETGAEDMLRENKKDFKFFKCPACRQKIRVPKGKGKIEITCPRCGDRFIKKT